MDFTITKDDHLLFRAAVDTEQPEQILAHGGGAQFDEQLVIEILAGVFVLGQVSLGERLAGADILHACLEDRLFGEDAFFDIGLALDDLTGGQIAVLLGLNEGVFVGRFAEISDVVGGDLLILGGGVL